MVDAYLQFTEPGSNAVSLSGETRDKVMIKQSPAPFEIKSWNFGSTNPLTVSSGTGGLATGKVDFKPFAIEKTIDLASPFLYHTCCAGGHYRKLTLWQRKSGGASANVSGQVFLQYNFQLCFITKISWSHSDDGPTESVEFAYGALGITYLAQDSSGKFGNKQQAKWDRVRNAQTLDAGIGETTIKDPPQG